MRSDKGTIRWDVRGYTREEFIEAWQSSDTIAQVIRKLKPDLKGRPGILYPQLRATAERLGLDDKPRDPSKAPNKKKSVNDH